MPLPSALNTNEVKNSAGTEVEFSHLQTIGRTREFVKTNESPGYPHRIKFAHREVGSGTNRRRQSVMRLEQTIVGQIDLDSTAKMVCQVTVDLPIGNLTAYSEPKNLLANLMSLLASQGATTTILFDNTGYGAEALINGSL